VQPVTAIVDRDALQLEAAGVAADVITLLDDDRLRPLEAVQLPGGGNTGRPGAENGDAGGGHLHQSPNLIFHLPHHITNGTKRHVAAW
jgi:hypothetical protein